MELDTDVIDEDFDAPPAPRTRRTVKRTLARKPRLILEREEQHSSPPSPQQPHAKRQATETSEATASLPATPEKKLTRYGRMASDWVGGKISPPAAAMCVDAAVSLLQVCLNYYGLASTTDAHPQETIRMRVLCLTDRYVTAAGGLLPETTELREVLLVTSLLLMKMWTDQSCHLKLLEWRKADVPRIAALERRFLETINFKTHLSHANIYDFSTRLRTFEE